MELKNALKHLMFASTSNNDLTKNDVKEKLESLWTKYPKEMNTWVEALRSGKYEQGKSRLYNSLNYTYCCLGVVARCQGLLQNDIQKVFFLYNLDLEFEDYPMIVSFDKELQRRFAKLNDTQELDFNTIADILSAFNPNS